MESSAYCCPGTALHPFGTLVDSTMQSASECCIGAAPVEALYSFIESYKITTQSLQRATLTDLESDDLITIRQHLLEARCINYAIRE